MSQGGFLAMRCALVHPERVRALILIATQTGTDDPTMLQGYNKMLDAWIANKLPEEIATTLEHVMTAPNLLGAFDTLVRRDDIKVSAIRVPTLIIHGDADAAIPLAKAEAMQASIPNAELVVVEGGHSINMTNPAPVNAAIEAFLARHRLVS
jgi:pimeloyl-ACP methyl ester carboxylesterase